MVVPTTPDQCRQMNTVQCLCNYYVCGDELNMHSRIITLAPEVCTGPYAGGFSRTTPFPRPRPLSDDHFQLEGRLVHCTLDEIHVQMLIV